MAASIVIDDRHIQPPTAQTQKFDSAEVVDKGVQLDKLKVDAEDEETTIRGNDKPDLGEEDLPKINISEDAWLSRSRTAFDTSSSYFDNNVRGELDDSIRAFHNQHKSGSHYSTTTNHFTSKVYRPKTRSVINKYEAMADAAYFSNPDVVSIEAENPSNKDEVIGASVTKALLQYRLTKTVPWYHIVIGGFQDAQVQGLAIAHYYWKIKTANKAEITEDGDTLTSKFLAVDEPCVELIPLENFRFDPNANWTNIVDSSPFIIHLRPMYICDIKAQMETGFFTKLSDSELMSASGGAKTGQNTRTARAQSGQDPREKSSKELNEYEVVVVQEHIHRVEGEDYVWYTLDNQAMLKQPVPIKELYFTGDRPYVIGSCVLETHNSFVSSTPTLLSGIQEEINEVANQRLNNVKLALNKKFIIKTDSEIDLSALLRNQPGSAVFTQNPTDDVRELSTPDVTQSAYLEQDRLNADFDELAGNFTAGTVQQQKGRETWRTNQMLNSNANVQLEHQLRIFTDTFVTPLLRAIIKLEQKYETDETIFALVGNQVGDLFQRFGVDQATDEMLQHELVVKCNVGMNSTDPQMKQQRLINALNVILELSSKPAAKGFDMKEVTKEIFALNGYGDGMRFINQEQDPIMAQLIAENMMLKQKMLSKDNHDKTALQQTRENNQMKLTIASMKEKNDSAKFLVQHAVDIAKMQDATPQQAQVPQQGMPALI